MYVVWGSAAWSLEVHGHNNLGWMYNILVMDTLTGAYTMYPILQSGSNGIIAEHPDLLFPIETFDYATVQETTHNNMYDMTSGKLFLQYANVIRNDMSDVLTYVNDDFTLDVGTMGQSPTHWGQFLNEGYSYWLPCNEPEDSPYYAE